MSNTCHFPVGFVPLLRKTTLFAVAVCLCVPCLADDSPAPEAQQLATRYAELIGGSLSADAQRNQRGVNDSPARPRAMSGLVTRLPNVDPEQATSPRTFPPQRTAPSTTPRLGYSGTRIDPSGLQQFYAETDSTKQSSKQRSHLATPPVSSRLPLADNSKSPPATTRQGRLPGLSSPKRDWPAFDGTTGRPTEAIGVSAASSANSREAQSSAKKLARPSSFYLQQRQHNGSQQATSLLAAPRSSPPSRESDPRDATSGPLNLSVKLPPVNSTMVGVEIQPSVVPLSARDVEAPFPRLIFPDLDDLALQKVTQEPEGETASVDEAIGVVQAGQGSASLNSVDNLEPRATDAVRKSTVKTPNAIAADSNIAAAHQPGVVAPPVSRQQSTRPTTGLADTAAAAARNEHRLGQKSRTQVRRETKDSDSAALSRAEPSKSKRPNSHLAGVNNDSAPGKKTTSRNSHQVQGQRFGASAALTAEPGDPSPRVSSATDSERPPANAMVTKLESELAESNYPIAKSDAELPNAGSWSFQFADTPWPAVLKEFSRKMGLSLTINAVPAGTFTYSDDRAYGVSDAIDIFNDHLIPRGNILVRRHEQLIVFGTHEPVPDNFVPFVNAEEIDTLGRNALAGAAIPVTGMHANLAAQEAATVASSIGTIRPFANSSRILAIDTGTHLRRVRDLLRHSRFARGETGRPPFKREPTVVKEPSSPKASHRKTTPPRTSPVSRFTAWLKQRSQK